MAPHAVIGTRVEGNRRPWGTDLKPEARHCAVAGREGGRRGCAAPARPDAAAPAALAQGEKSGPKTVTIIDGTTGKRQEVNSRPGRNQNKRPEAQRESRSETGGRLDRPALSSKTRATARSRRSAPDGARPSEIYAQAAEAAEAGHARIRRASPSSSAAWASARTAPPRPCEASPGGDPAFSPYGSDLGPVGARARGEGHEVMLQAPMEPFDYPDSDPGPQTLLSEYGPERRPAALVDEPLHRLCRHRQPYGGALHRHEEALGPVLKEIGERGLMSFDDGASPRSRRAGRGRPATASAAPISSSTRARPAADRRRAGQARGERPQQRPRLRLATGLPVSIARIAEWAPAAEARRSPRPGHRAGEGRRRRGTLTDRGPCALRRRS